MRAVTAIALAALTGLSGFAAVACALLPILMTALTFFGVLPDWTDNSDIEKTVFWFSIPLGLFACAVFSTFAWLCWRLANAIWPNRIFTG